MFGNLPRFHQQYRQQVNGSIELCIDVYPNYS